MILLNYLSSAALEIMYILLHQGIIIISTKSIPCQDCPCQLNINVFALRFLRINMKDF